MKGTEKEKQVTFTIKISKSTHEAILEAQKDIRERLGVLVPLTKIISNHLEATKSKIQSGF